MRFHLVGSRLSLAVTAALLVAVTAAAQTLNFDDRPTGFLKAETGGTPADAWNGTSLATAKRLARESLDRSLAEQLQAEAVSFAQCAATPDFVEGIRAFLEKRPARFESES